MLVNGQWQRKWDPVQAKDSEGRFIRQSSSFTSRLGASDIESGRYSLIVGYICPWATRTLIARSLLGLEEHIDIKVVNPVLTDFGWRFGGFPGATVSGYSGVEYVHQLYTQTQADYTGRATVPVLWDNKGQCIVNNESADILKIFNQDMRVLHQSSIDLRPAAIEDAIDRFNERIYDSLNNGVYRAGFASSQQAYEEAVDQVFAALDQLEELFTNQKYALANGLTECDIRLFVTLVRFDPAYFSLFKTNVRRIEDYPALSAYLERLLQIEAFSVNTRIDHIKSGYYSIKALNPLGIVPKGPDLPWFKYLKEGV
ncbi:glutathione S-transferase family protein [Neptuniibacter caesariensis]|uniref:Glutathione S-transferase n=1 Tax=Neptuniibacter caesariensis TaxID=207954 RepID=A0A7U8C385_NEPCE|nr:glutathione S-transferase C-terminal domain-containing protein [Neptuniibacter caesariensis]EAR60675.1 glutathione S-transferase [Neptuniibacter caesariensis]